MHKYKVGELVEEDPELSESRDIEVVNSMIFSADNMSHAIEQYMNANPALDNAVHLVLEVTVDEL